jgi:hypothetical protein
MDGLFVASQTCDLPRRHDTDAEARVRCAESAVSEVKGRMLGSASQAGGSEAQRPPRAYRAWPATTYANVRALPEPNRPDDSAGLSHRASVCANAAAFPWLVAASPRHKQGVRQRVSPTESASDFRTAPISIQQTLIRR